MSRATTDGSARTIPIRATATVVEPGCGSRKDVEAETEGGDEVLRPLSSSCFGSACSRPCANGSTPESTGFRSRAPRTVSGHRVRAGHGCSAGAVPGRSVFENRCLWHRVFSQRDS